MIVEMAKSSTLAESSSNGNSKKNVNNFHSQSETGRFRSRSSKSSVELKVEEDPPSTLFIVAFWWSWDGKGSDDNKKIGKNISAE